VTVDGLPLDLLIDGLPAQNRAVRTGALMHSFSLVNLIKINFGLIFPSESWPVMRIAVYIAVRHRIFYCSRMLFFQMEGDRSSHD